MNYTLHYNKFDVCGAILRNYEQVRAKRKGKVVPVHAMRAYRESRVIAPLIRNLGTGWSWADNFMLR